MMRAQPKIEVPILHNWGLRVLAVVRGQVRPPISPLHGRGAMIAEWGVLSVGVSVQ